MWLAFYGSVKRQNSENERKETSPFIVHPRKPLYKVLLKQILWSLHCSYLKGLDKENTPVTSRYFSVIFGKWSEILDQDNFLLDHFMS